MPELLLEISKIPYFQPDFTYSVYWYLAFRCQTAFHVLGDGQYFLHHSTASEIPGYHVKSFKHICKTLSMAASRINASFSGSHPNHYTFIFVLLMHALGVIMSVMKMSCVILGKKQFGNIQITTKYIFQEYLCPISVGTPTVDLPELGRGKSSTVH